MLSEKYLEHDIHNFFNDIEDFYNSLSFAVFPWISIGTESIVNIDTYFFSSIKGTIKSLKQIVKSGQLNDGYALLRKYHDSIIINSYAGLYLQENLSQEGFIVEKIDAWIKGTIKLPRYGAINEYLKKSSKLKEVYELLNEGEKITAIRERCNNHMHFNFYRYALLNDDEISLYGREEVLSQLKDDFCTIFIMHFVYIFCINEHYMMASDYSEYLDMGDTPPENSQYWVAPYVQKMFDDVIKKENYKVANKMKSMILMQLE